MATTDFTKPLALFFQEIESDSKTLITALNRLEIECQHSVDPKAFLLDIRKLNPAICFIDVTTPKMDIAVAIMRTIRSIIGQNPPILALVPKGDKKTTTRALEAGADLVLEQPLDKTELATKLFKYVVTSAISEVLKPKLSAAFNTALPEDALVEVPLPKVIGWIFEKISPAMGAISSSIETFEESEVQLKFYAERLLPHREEFVKMVQALRKSKDKLDMTQSLRLYGISNARYLSVAFSLSEATGANDFQWNSKTGMPNIDPRNYLQFGVKSVEHFGEGSRYEHVAFSAGLVFDLLTAMSQGAGERKRGLLKMIEAAHADGLTRASRGLAQGKSSKDLALDRHIISTMMMREAGKIAMAMYYPDYLDLRTRFEKKGLKPILQHISENESYAVSHNLIGALICQVAPGLKDAYKAVMFCDSPFMLGGVKEDHDSYSLAKLCESL